MLLLGALVMLKLNRRNGSEKKNLGDGLVKATEAKKTEKGNETGNEPNETETGTGTKNPRNQRAKQTKSTLLTKSCKNAIL